jgi:Formin Homology 2 Domain.
LNAGGLNPPTGLPKLGPPQLGGPSGGGLPLPNLTLPQNTAPKKRLKPVFIEAIAAIKLQQTIFAKAQQNKEDFKMTELEELFESAPSAMAQSKDAGAQGQQQKKSTNICLIPDSKRAYNMSIMIMKFKKYTFKDLRQALIDLKADIITVDACCTLLPFVPLPEEQDACQSYDGKLEDLDQSSQFLMAIYDIPRLAFRLKATIFKSEFDARIEAITKDIQVFKSGCTLLQDNTHFQTFLMAAVEAANVLNQGTARANAGGIKPASIIGFNNVKANKPGITLFSYLVDKIHKKNPKILSFAEEFKVFDDVSKINVEDVIRDVEMIKSQVNTIKIHLESAEKTNPQDTGFINAFKGFYLKAFPIVQETDASAKSAKELYVTVAKLMGEDDESMKKKTCEDFFVVFKQLSDLVLKTMKDLKL